LAFIDNETIIVANRRGEVPIFRIPPGGDAKKNFNTRALLTIGCNNEHKVETPGSVSVRRLERSRFEILICNNYVNHVSRHILEKREHLRLTSNEILLSDGLTVPDGVAVSNDYRWIAISNHDRHCVSLYQNKPGLNPRSKPDGILRDIIYPHGVRFTADGNYVIVADAGSPYVNIYARNGDSWEGTHSPQATVRVMDDAAYYRGRINPQEGGPKGIDIDRDMNILVTTCEEEVLQFLDLRQILLQRGVPLDKRIKYLQWRHGWRYDRFKRRLSVLRGAMSA
jgi:DNA-binding beta-propeller fold protein YncE